jgi:small GTP-binding protein
MDELRLKAVLIGDTGVGKSCIFSQLSTGTYDEEHRPTIGGACATLQVTDTTGRTFSIGIWDTAGQERYKTVVPMYFENADFILMVYSVTDRTTFDHIPAWQEIATLRASPTARLFILGNKSDLAPGVEVNASDLAACGDKLGAVLAIEVSAKTSAGLDILIRGLAEQCAPIMSGDEVAQGMNVADPINTAQPRSCC